MYPVGVLFGLGLHLSVSSFFQLYLTQGHAGFDTASSIALLAVSAIAKQDSEGHRIPSSHVVVLPVRWVYSSYFPLCFTTLIQRKVAFHSWNVTRWLPRLNSDVVFLHRPSRGLSPVANLPTQNNSRTDRANGSIFQQTTSWRSHQSREQNLSFRSS